MHKKTVAAQYGDSLICTAVFSYFQILVLLWLLDLHFLTCPREADAVLKYLRELCGAKKLDSLVFEWVVLSRSPDDHTLGIKGWCISLW